MSLTREVVTIQAGNFANFIGTHWWNIQESSFCYTPDSSTPLDINHDVLFREGLSPRGEVTYTPRLVLIDLQDNVTGIRRECSLYRSPNDDKGDMLWDGKVEVVKENAYKKNPYLEEPESVAETSKSDDANSKKGNACQTSHDFNSPTTVWSDFLKTNLHPNSFCLFNELSSSSDRSPLDLYSNGEEMYMSLGKEDIQDATRRMTEECDYLQGFNFLFDAHNGFSGVSSLILQHLEDEYKGRPSICFPVYQNSNNIPVLDIKEQMHRLYATVNSMSNMNSHCSFFSPLSLSDDVVKLSQPYKSFPCLQYDESLLYHTSAIFAAAIETLTSPFRLKTMKFNMGDITSSMSTYGRKLVCSSTCFPFPLSQDAYLNTLVEKDIPEYHMRSLTPFYRPASERTQFQSAVLRGVPVNKFHNLGKSLYHALEPEEIFGQYLNKYSSSSVTTATVFHEQCSVVEPFPQIFKDNISDSGFLNSSAHSIGKGVSKVAMAASFSSSDSAGRFIEDLVSQACKLSFKEYFKCTETTYEKDSYLEVIENLRGLQDNYQNYS